MNDPDRRPRGAPATDQGTSAGHRDPSLEVVADIVVRLATGETLLIARVNATRAPRLASLLAGQRRGERMPTGTARWTPRWHDDRLGAVELRARLHTSPPLELTLRFALPTRAKTLRRLPTQIALTDGEGFDRLQHTHRLPWALLLPEASTDVLSELLGPAD